MSTPIIIPQMPDETRSQLLQLQHELYAPGQRLANVLRRAVVVSSILGKHEYRILFELHLSGIIKESQIRPESAGLPEGHQPEIDHLEAFMYDRSRRDGNIVPLSVDELEALNDRATTVLSSNTTGASQYLEVQQNATLTLARIRNRVNHFIASMLASSPTAARQTSSLTGLLSLPEFSKDLDVLLHRQQKHLSIAFVDMDNLKRLNEEIGHDRADAIIQKVARILSSTLLNRGTVYHRSGDEFLVILPNHTSGESQMLMTRVCQRVAEHDFEQGLTPGSITISVGVVEHGVHANSADALREASIRANQTAKSEGKNRVFAPTPG